MSQRRLYHSPPHMSGLELEYIADAIRSNWVAPVGPQLDEFERLFVQRIGTQHAVAVTTGTAAIHLALRYLDLQRGDEVVCSSFTFCASANPIMYEQATPVFIDSDKISWNMDPNLLEEELSECAKKGRLPRALIVVDILGQSADMDAIVSIASQYEIPVIEDAAEALGGMYKERSVGTAGWASTFSFNGNKVITTSGGGMLCSDDEGLIEQARFLATQARDPAPYYEHSKIGFNYRLSNLLAAVGIAQLKVLDERVNKRRSIFEFYKERLGILPGITMMPIAEYGVPNYWLSVIQVDASSCGATAEDIRLRLEADNIESRRVWKPMHCQPVFKDCRMRGGDVAEELFETGLCLPSGTAMNEDDLERVVVPIEQVARGE